MTGNNSQACYLARLQSPDFRVTYNFAAAWFSKVKFLFMNILTDKEISIFRSEKDNKIISVKQLVNNRWQSTGAQCVSIFLVFQSRNLKFHSINQFARFTVARKLFWNLNFDQSLKKKKNSKRSFLFINNYPLPNLQGNEPKHFRCWVHFGNAKYVIMPVILIAWMTFAWFEQETKSARLLYRCRIFCGNDFTRYSRYRRGETWSTCVAYVESVRAVSGRCSSIFYARLIHQLVVECRGSETRGTVLPTFSREVLLAQPFRSHRENF